MDAREWLLKARGKYPQVETQFGKLDWTADLAELFADEQNAELCEQVAALTQLGNKVNEIRNSIIGLQSINWSEHIYPLVAALDEAGFEGMGYDKARPYYGTMLERTLAAEAALKEAQVLLGKIQTAAVEANQGSDPSNPRAFTHWVAGLALSASQPPKTGLSGNLTVNFGVSRKEGK